MHLGIEERPDLGARRIGGDVLAVEDGLGIRRLDEQLVFIALGGAEEHRRRVLDAGAAQRAPEAPCAVDQMCAWPTRNSVSEEANSFGLAYSGPAAADEKWRLLFSEGSN
jgi:hypothetical protein